MNTQIIKNIITNIVDFNKVNLYIINYDYEYFEDGYISYMTIIDNDLYIYGKSKLSTDDEDKVFEIIDISKNFLLKITEDEIIINDIKIRIEN